MKRLLYILTITLVLVSCGTKDGYFKIEGRFLNLNQGEFYVYSTDGAVAGVDTIRISGGRFVYEMRCNKPSTLMMVFPNFSEQPVFAEPGEKVTMKADASHLKELTVEGTALNKQMNSFRAMIANVSPPEAIQKAEMFIGDHPESIVSNYLLRRYFIQTPTPNLTKASALLSKLIQAQPKNGDLVRLKKDVDRLCLSLIGKQLPPFTATAVNGRTVSGSDLRGKVAVVHTWSTWNYESQDVQRRIRYAKNDYGARLAVLGINIDGSKHDCEEFLKRDSLPWPTVCDEKMFEGELMEKLGLSTVPDNIVIDASGKIVARGLLPDDMKKKLEELLK